MIVIISHPGDTHAQCVARVMEERGHNPFMLDFSHFTENASVSLLYEGNKGEFHYHDDEWGDLDFSKVNSVWWRRPQPFTIAEEVGDPQHRMFAMAEAHEVFGGLSGLLDAYWMNVPDRDDLAHRKVFQLRMAQRLGIEMPRTLITNSTDDANAFINNLKPCDTVFKPFRGTPDAWRETRLIGEDEIGQIDSVSYAPLIFQEYIKGSDIRVTVVGEHIFAAEIDISEGDYPVDFRMNYDNMKITDIELPDDVRQSIRKLMQGLGLVYGAIDFRKTPENRFVFLEINPAGQWLFIENKTGQPITEAIASTLIEFDQAQYSEAV